MKCNCNLINYHKANAVDYSIYYSHIYHGGDKTKQFLKFNDVTYFNKKRFTRTTVTCKIKDKRLFINDRLITNKKKTYFSHLFIIAEITDIPGIRLNYLCIT